MTTIILVPVYGRDYKSKKEVMADWDADMDFIIASIRGGDAGHYFNKTDALRERQINPLKWIYIRHKNETQICLIDVAKMK